MVPKFGRQVAIRKPEDRQYSGDHAAIMGSRHGGEGPSHLGFLILNRRIVPGCPQCFEAVREICPYYAVKPNRRSLEGCSLVRAYEERVWAWFQTRAEWCHEADVPLIAELIVTEVALWRFDLWIQHARPDILVDESEMADRLLNRRRQFEKSKVRLCEALLLSPASRKKAGIVAGGVAGPPTVGEILEVQGARVNG